VKDERSYLDRVLLPRFAKRKIGSIGPQDIVEIIAEQREKGLSSSTIANTLKPLSRTFEYAVFKSLIATNPITQVPRGYRPSCNTTRDHREWTTEEVERLIRVAYERDARPEARSDYGLSIEAKLRTGMRLGELLGAQYGDVETEELSSGRRVAVLHVRRQWTKDGRVDEPKTKKALRRIPLSPTLSAKIAARKLSHGAGDIDFIFAPSRGSTPPLHSNWRRRGWNKAVTAAGLTDGPKVTPHDARHAFASMMAEAGLSSADVAEVMGHTTAGVTERIYTHAFNREAREERVREAMAAAMSGGTS
jgi:integrase